MGARTASEPMGEAVDEQLQLHGAEDVRAVVTYLRSIPAWRSSDLPATLAPRPTPVAQVAR